MSSASTLARLKPLLIAAAAIVALPFLLKAFGLSLNTGTWIVGRSWLNLTAAQQAATMQVIEQYASDPVVRATRSCDGGDYWDPGCPGCSYN